VRLWKQKKKGITPLDALKKGKKLGKISLIIRNPRFQTFWVALDRP
jgi:hypothetical protein